MLILEMDPGDIIRVDGNLVGFVEDITEDNVVLDSGLVLSRDGHSFEVGLTSWFRGCFYGES